MPIATLSLAESAAQVVAWARGERRVEGARVVAATSVHGLVEGWRNPALRAILQTSALITPDGMPLVWVGRLKGAAEMGRVYGPDLMLETCRQAAGTGVRHYLYGGATGVPERLADGLLARFPGLVVAGGHSPPFRELSDAELDEDAARLDAAGADLVWLGLGTPRQERRAAQLARRVRARVLVTVGAAFDFHTGRVRQAPRLLQKTGLEWAYRLSLEPRRLWRRYLTNVPLFVILATAELLGLMSIGTVPSEGRDGGS